MRPALIRRHGAAAAGPRGGRGGAAAGPAAEDPSDPPAITTPAPSSASRAAPGPHAPSQTATARQRLRALLSAALAPSNAERASPLGGSRAAHLSSIAQLFTSAGEDGQPALLDIILQAWQPLLGCLWDPNPFTRAAAARLLGTVGAALASGITPPRQPGPHPTRGGGPSGRGGRGRGRGGGKGPPDSGGGGPGSDEPVRPTLLFDWLLPLLSEGANLPGSGRPASPDVQTTICSTLAAAVSQLPPGPVPSPQATSRDPPAHNARPSTDAVPRTLASVHQLLESEATPPELLAPLLRLLACCARCAPAALCPLWEDVLDLLLGWTLEPRLSEADRRMISGAVSCLGPCWAAPEAQRAALQVAAKLLSDLEPLASDVPDGAAVGTAGGDTAEGAAAGRGGDEDQPAAPLEPRERERLARFCSLAGCLVAILCGVRRWGPRLGAATDGSGQECGAEGDSSGAPVIAPRLLQLLLVVHGRLASAAATAETLVCDTVRLSLLTLSALDSASAAVEESSQVYSVLVALTDCLGLGSLPRATAVELLGALSTVVRPGVSSELLLEAPLAAAWPPLFAAAAPLRASAHPDVAAAAAGACLAALARGPADPLGGAAQGALLSELAGLREQWCGPASAQGGAQQEGGRPQMPIESDREQQRRLVCFDLALAAAWAENASSSSSVSSGGGGRDEACQGVSAAVRPAAAPPAAALEAAGVAVALLNHAVDQAPDAELGELCIRSLAALCCCACAPSDTDGASDAQDSTGEVLDASRTHLVAAAFGGLQAAAAAEALPVALREAALAAAVTVARAAAPSKARRDAAACTAAIAEATAASEEPQLRLSAVDAASAAAVAALEAGSGPTTGAGATVLLSTRLLLQLASDEAPIVASAAREALPALALPAFLLSSSTAPLGQPPAGASLTSSGSPRDPLGPPSREAVGLQRQLRGFRSAQLAATFEELFLASPSLSLLTRRPAAAPNPGAGSCSGGADAGAEAGTTGLLALARDLPLLPPQEPSAGQQQQQQQQDQPPAHDPDQMTSASAAAWYLSQEAARACVAARLKTHLGGSAQSLAALERLLQGALSRLQAAAAAAGPDAAAAGAQQRKGAAHLLEFVTALEAGVQAAAEGCLGRPAPPQGVMAFYGANHRVCAEWFSRSRDLLLRLSNAAGCPHHALHHGGARLADVRAQLRAVLAADSLYRQQREAAESAAAAAAASGAATAGAAAGGRGGEASAVAARGRGGARGRGRSRGRGEERAAAMAVTAIVTPPNASASAAPAAAAAPPVQLPSPEEHRAQQEAALARLAPAAAEALMGCAAAFVALGDADGVRGLHDWAADELAPLWKREAAAFEFLGAESDPSAAAGEVDGDSAAERALPSVAGPAALSWLRGLEARAAWRLSEAARLIAAFLARSGALTGGGFSSSSLVAVLQAPLVETLGECYAGARDWVPLASLSTEAARRAEQLSAAATDASAAAAAATAAAGADVGGGAAASAAPQTRQHQQAVAQARRAAAAAARAAAALADMECAKASVLSQWDFAGSAAAQAAGAPAAAASAPSGPAALGDPRAAIAAALSWLQQPPRCPPAPSRGPPPTAAVDAAAASLADRCGWGAWLPGTPALLPQLRDLSAVHLLRSMLSRQPDATAAALAARAIEAAVWDTPDDGDASAPGWARLLRDDGGLALGRLQPALPQLAPLLTIAEAGAAARGQAAVWTPVTSSLRRATAAAAAAAGDSVLLSRTLAAAQEENGASVGVNWPRLVGSRLLLECGARGGRSPLTGDAGDAGDAGGPVVQAIREHLAVLEGCWPHQLDAAGTAAGSKGPPAGASHALALVSFAAVLRRGPADAAPEAAAVDWRAAFEASTATLTRRGLLAGADGAVLPTLAPAGPALPLAACFAAAAAAAPQLPGPWRAFGDLVYGIGREKAKAAEGAATDADAGSADKGESQQLPADAHHAFALAATAYARCLAAGAASGSLACPEAGLHPLLRLLRLVLRRASELETPLRAALGASPAAAWQALAPQLLAAAAAHREPRARALAAALLRGVAAVAPCSVLFACVAELRAAEERGEQAPPELAGVLSELGRHDPRLVPETRALVDALERLTVTPAERWAALLADLSLDVPRKLLALRADAARLAAAGRVPAARRADVLAARYAAVVAPAVAAIERQLAASGFPAGVSGGDAAASPVSPEEARFRTAFLPAAAAALAALKSPPRRLLERPEDLGEAWAGFAALQERLAAELRRNRLDLMQCAPELVAIRGGAIPMPSDDLASAALPPLPLDAALNNSSSPAAAAAVSPTSSGGGWLTIAAVSPQALALPTKTRPKRLRFLASDGTVHSFLLKGRDDLRVDERVMQFMRAANAVAGSSSADGDLGGDLRSDLGPPIALRQYSVTPLGPRAGLVQWVPHTLSLFALFRSWQAAAAARAAAVAAAKRAAEGGGGAGSGAAADAGEDEAPQLPLMVAATRPADAFYARLLPALHAAGLPRNTPRKDWPADVLRTTFLSLAREAPRHLLSRELWASAGSAPAWWARACRFCHSAAAGSIVGWLLGIGDRHLDNMLLDKGSGELIHIDFSVCLDKGAALRVPEVVPFRLTPLLQAALGPTGKEGAFRAACERALASLRAAREPLVALLGLLLEDPGVDWAAEREAQAARRDVDAAVSLHLFASRVDEMRRPLLAALRTSLPPVGDALAALVSYGSAHVYMRSASERARAARADRARAAAALDAARSEAAAARAAAAAAASDSAAAGAEVQRLGGLAGGALADSSTWCARHLKTLKALSEVPPPPELTAPSSSWLSTDSPCPLMLVAPGAAAAAAAAAGGGPPQQGLFDAALSALGAGPARHALPPALWQQCAAMDARGTLLAARDDALTAALTALLQYSLVLRGVLPDDYGSDSHHAKYAEAFSLALNATTSDAVAAAASAAPAALDADVIAREWACLAASHAVAGGRPAALHTAAAAAEDRGSLQGGGGDCSAAAAAALELKRALFEASAGLADGGSEQDAARAQLAIASGLAAALRRAAEGLKLPPPPATDSSDGGHAGTGGGEEGVAAALQTALGVQRLLRVFEAEPGVAALLADAGDAGGLPSGQDPPSDDPWGAAGEDEGMMATGVRHGSSGKAWRDVEEGATALTRAQQLLVGLRHQAAPVLAVWAADALNAPAGGGSGTAVAAAPGLYPPAPDTPGLHRHVWLAAADAVRNGTARLSALLSDARELEGRLTEAAAAAAAAGPGTAAANAVWALQERCGEAERALLLALHTCLGPLLGLGDPTALRDACAAATAEARAAAQADGGRGDEASAAAPPVLAQPAVPIRAGSPHLLDAWQPAVHALLQLGALAYATTGDGEGEGEGEKSSAGEDGAAPLAASPPGPLASGPLPLDLAGLRPLLFVVDALHAALCPSPDSSSPAAERAEASPAAASLQRLLDAAAGPVLRAHLPALTQALQSRAASADRLADEAAAVLTRRGASGSHHARRPAAGGAGLRDEFESSSGAPALVPFTAFDPNLAGADELLEDEEQALDWPTDRDDDSEDGNTGRNGSKSGLQSGLQSGLEGDEGDDWMLGGGGNGGADGNSGQLPGLVRFDAFDPDLPGAGMALEDEETLESSLLEGPGDTGRQKGEEEEGSGGVGADAAVAAARSLGVQLQQAAADAVTAGGAAAAAAAQAAALRGLAAGCEAQRRLWLRHLAAFEWLWEEELSLVLNGSDGEAGSSGDDLGAEAAAALLARATALAKAATAAVGEQPQSVGADDGGSSSGGGPQPLPRGAGYQALCREVEAAAGYHRVPGWREMVAAWKAAARTLESLQSPLQAWAADSATAAASAAAALAPTADTANSVHALLQAREAWLAAAQGVADGVSHVLEAAVQLEASRRGLLWDPTADADLAAFQGNDGLIAQLVDAAGGLVAAEARLVASEAREASARASEAAAAAAIAEADAVESEAAATLASKAAAMLSLARALPPALPPGVDAAARLLPLADGEVSEALTELSATVSRGAAGSRDLAPLAAAAVALHGRAAGALRGLEAIARGAAAALSEIPDLPALLTAALSGEIHGSSGGVGVGIGSGKGEQQQQRVLRDRQVALVDVLLAALDGPMTELQAHLAELGQTHLLFQELCRQLDGLASAASMVASSVLRDHQGGAAGAGAVGPEGTAAAAAASGGGGGPAGVGAAAADAPGAGAAAVAAAAAALGRVPPRSKHAEARRRAFVQAALRRCAARLGSPGDAPQADPTVSAAGAVDAASVRRSVDRLIAAATSVDNLSRMFEGWQAWI